MEWSGEREQKECLAPNFAKLVERPHYKLGKLHLEHHMTPDETQGARRQGEGGQVGWKTSSRAPSLLVSISLKSEEASALQSPRPLTTHSQAKGQAARGQAARGKGPDMGPQPTQRHDMPHDMTWAPSPPSAARLATRGRTAGSALPRRT